MNQARVLSAPRPWPSPPRHPQRRRGLIDVLRVLLPAVALILIGLVLAWPQIMRSPGIAVSMLAPDDADQSGRLRMDSPRYVGQTKKNRPYEVTAQSASLDPRKANIVHLDHPAADIALGDEGDVRLSAQDGTYDRNTQKLLLDGGIEVVTSSGYRFATPSARVNLAQGWVRGWQPIEGAGPRGKLSADRFEIENTGDILRFEGRVKVTVLPPEERDDPASDSATVRTEGGPAS
jgi:lipopolysaccharide export system protein LptC